MTDEAIRQTLRDKKRRKRSAKRIIAVILSVAVVSVAGYYTGKAMGNRRYDKEMKSFVSITEDVPMVNAAKGELGNRGGEKYWTWYGYGRRVDWCAIFASWCEDQCGYIDGMIAPAFENVGDGGHWFENRDLYAEPGSIPEPGDLIFFDWDQDENRDHVGIVAAVRDDLVFTIEGNSSDIVRYKRYHINDPVISGYGQIAR